MSYNIKTFHEEDQEEIDFGILYEENNEFEIDESIIVADKLQGNSLAFSYSKIVEKSRKEDFKKLRDDIYKNIINAVKNKSYSITKQIMVTRERIPSNGCITADEFNELIKELKSNGFNVDNSNYQNRFESNKRSIIIDWHNIQK